MLLEEYAFEKGNHGFQLHTKHFLTASHWKESFNVEIPVPDP